jgi:hypothetical protein
LPNNPLLGHLPALAGQMGSNLMEWSAAFTDSGVGL